jgi:murein DD-endopeptidase MepM/ murein hydrolase activator NlpD
MIRIRPRTSNPLAWVAILSITFSLSACSRHKIPVEKPPAPPKRPGVYHVVEKHQTLYRICKTYQVDLHEVASVNGIADPGRIRPGQRIFIPGAKAVLKVEIYFEDVVAEPADKEQHKTLSKQPGFSWPVRGKCVDFFEETDRKRHQGLDIACPLGTPVRAASSGVVVYSGNTIKGYGNLIILRHSEEFVTVYAHHETNLVEEGAAVKEGQVIAKAGQTGRATGPHLHFEIRKNNRAVDPLPLLR